MMKAAEPAYMSLASSGELKRRGDRAQAFYTHCTLCPHACGVNRARGETGLCGAPAHAVVASAGAHLGEESVLCGTDGSGTIFFSHCGLRCVFCQNKDIAHTGVGRAMREATLAATMLSLQQAGCPNVNLVTPTHFVPSILAALDIAVQSGFALPIVYNTSSYETRETLALLDGVVDIYLADMKFMAAAPAKRFTLSHAADYGAAAREAIQEMHRQCGDLVVDARGVARRGLMIRHLVMPNRIAGTGKFLTWAAKYLSQHVYLNIMAQYHPPAGMDSYPDIDRGVSAAEFVEAVEWALDASFTHLDDSTLRQYRMLKRRHRH